MCQAFYWAFALDRMTIIPGSTLSVSMQWAVIGSGGLLSVAAAAMLLRIMIVDTH
jgi:hypothetical protein